MVFYYRLDRPRREGLLGSVFGGKSAGAVSPAIPQAPAYRAPGEGMQPPTGSWTPSWWPSSENKRRQDTANPVPADEGYR
jgi:hypothetical protein